MGMLVNAGFDAQDSSDESSDTTDQELVELLNTCASHLALALLGWGYR